MKLSIQDTVLPYILELNNKYHLAGVWFDPWQAQSLVKNYRMKE